MRKFVIWFPCSRARENFRCVCNACSLARMVKVETHLPCRIQLLLPITARNAERPSPWERRKACARGASRR